MRNWRGKSLVRGAAAHYLLSPTASIPRAGILQPIDCKRVSLVRGSRCQFNLDGKVKLEPKSLRDFGKRMLALDDTSAMRESSLSKKKHQTVARVV